MDTCHRRFYSPPLYQLSYRRLMGGAVVGIGKCHRSALSLSMYRVWLLGCWLSAVAWARWRVSIFVAWAWAWASKDGPWGDRTHDLRVISTTL